MSDYISREAAVTIADYAADEYPYDKDPKKPETYSEYNQGWHDACDYIRGKLEEENPADVESVRHGEWRLVRRMAAFGEYKCSVCGRIETFGYFNKQENNPYCHCGAKMELEDENHVGR